MSTAIVIPRKASDAKEQWVRDISRLTEQVSGWAGQEPGWTVQMDSTDLSEETLGAYTAPVVTMDTPKGRLLLEPIARNHPGRGIVELYAWPTLFRVRLLRGDDYADWRVRVDSGSTLHQEWNRENFITLANDLLAAS